MKVGIRTPNISKSIKARTTGKIKRKVKKAVNPLYGKKEMGFVRNPKKAVYNKIYNKTTFSFGDMFKPNKKDNFIILFFKLIIYLYYLIIKYLIYVPIKFIVNKINNQK